MIDAVGTEIAAGPAIDAVMIASKTEGFVLIVAVIVAVGEEDVDENAAKEEDANDVAAGEEGLELEEEEDVDVDDVAAEEDVEDVAAGEEDVEDVEDVDDVTAGEETAEAAARAKESGVTGTVTAATT